MLSIPESHTLYLCPAACGRRQGLRALRNGVADDVSFLQFSEQDFISGTYESASVEAVAELLDLLPQNPQVIFLYVNCIDDFLGTDGTYLVRRLEESFPTIHFLLSRINPIAADVGTGPAGESHAHLYGLL